jgi:hypothetical protein
MSAAPYWCTVAQEKAPSATVVVDCTFGFLIGWLLMPLNADMPICTAAYSAAAAPYSLCYTVFRHLYRYSCFTSMTRLFRFTQSAGMMQSVAYTVANLQLN